MGGGLHGQENRCLVAAVEIEDLDKISGFFCSESRPNA